MPAYQGVRLEDLQARRGVSNMPALACRRSLCLLALGRGQGYQAGVQLVATSHLLRLLRARQLGTWRVHQPGPPATPTPAAPTAQPLPHLLWLKPQVLRILFGWFPTYRGSPLAPRFSRVLQVGDASGIQSPLRCRGGAASRHVPFGGAPAWPHTHSAPTACRAACICVHLND